MDTWAWILWAVLALVTIATLIIAINAWQVAASARDRSKLTIDHGEAVASIVLDAREEAKTAASRAENAMAITRQHRADCASFSKECLKFAGQLADAAEQRPEFVRIDPAHSHPQPHGPSKAQE